MHVRNEQEPRVGVDLGKPYIVVGRVDGVNKKSFMWVWDINGNRWVDKKVSSSGGIPSKGNEVITIGRSSQKAHEWLQGEIAEYSMWDTFVSDLEVENIVQQYLKMLEQNENYPRGQIQNIPTPHSMSQPSNSLIDF